MTERDFERALSFLKGLADETRLRIVGILANGERTVEELAALLSVKAPTVSHHLGILRELDLVAMEREGNSHVYRFVPETLRRLGREVICPRMVASLGTAVDQAAWERRVLRDFMDGESIRQIPVRQKKRLVILKWLSRKFEPGARYPERAINEMLKVHHPDYATLRRELVDHRFMARQNGVYWLLPGPDWAGKDPGAGTGEREEGA